jgi:hypothetical protein
MFVRPFNVKQKFTKAIHPGFIITCSPFEISNDPAHPLEIV